MINIEARDLLPQKQCLAGALYGSKFRSTKSTSGVTREEDINILQIGTTKLVDQGARNRDTTFPMPDGFDLKRVGCDPPA
jgi:hypothetical protein